MEKIMARTSALRINGVDFPFKYNGYTVQKNKIWSANTRRTNSGKLVGTIIAIKRKIEGTLVPITSEQASILDSVLASDTEFFTVSYLDVDGEYKSFSGYLGDVSYPFVGTNVGAKGRILIKDVQVSVIER